jgi:multidrug resistance efflux pump
MAQMAHSLGPQGSAEPTRLSTLPAMAEVELVTPVKVVAWGVVLGFLALVVALAFLPWQQSVTGEGRVIAMTPIERQQTVSSTVDGRVVRWHVVEGTRVRAGDLIVEVADNDPNVVERLRGELNAAREREQSLDDRIREIRSSRENALAAADARITMAAERVAAAERALDQAEATLLLARQNLDRQKALLNKGLTPVRSVEIAQADYDRAVAEVARAENGLRAARADQAAIERDRMRVENDYDAQLKDAIATRAAATAAVRPIETRLARQTTQDIRAPRDGVILRLLAQPGSEMLKSGQPLAVLVPETDQQVVELWVKGNDMPLLHVDDPVRLQFEGWPAIQFVGWPSVAVGTFGGRIILVDATDDGSGKFRILVAPDPNDDPWPPKQYLRQGVRANGWVLLKMVPLWFELWRQFNGFPPTSPKGPILSDADAKEKK